MVSVPRLYEKIYATARHKATQGPAIQGEAVRVGDRRRPASTRTRRRTAQARGPWLAARHALADRLVLHKIRDIVGGPKNFFSAGGAALSPAIEEFFFAAGLLICQGYGLTETSPMLTCNRPGDFKFGTVGKVIPGCEVRIAPDGEILARGRNVMGGYFNRPQETTESFEDGWLKTGDIGDFDEDGFLRITDRKKDLIITSGGKNIAPSRIESVIGQDYYIEQVAAVGDGRHYLSALVVPQFEALEEWARENGLHLRLGQGDGEGRAHRAVHLGADRAAAVRPRAPRAGEALHAAHRALQPGGRRDHAHAEEHPLRHRGEVTRTLIKEMYAVDHSTGV